MMEWTRSSWMFSKAPKFECKVEGLHKPYHVLLAVLLMRGVEGA